MEPRMTTHTHTGNIHSNPTGSFRSVIARYRLMYGPSKIASSTSRVPHPGDILYWVGCVSAVSALLFFATR